MAKKQKLNILMISPECVPFAKTGGLADVVGALPKYLKALGHDVRVVMPRYTFISQSKFNIELALAPVGIWMGTQEEWCAIHTCMMDDDIPVYFVEHNLYFDREGLYHDKEFNDYTDNPRRFAFLTRAALQLCKSLEYKPDIVHTHDWQTALAPAYLKIWHWNDPILGGAASVLTIHNIGYQGKYPASHYNYLGLQWANFISDKFEDNGAINFLKGGIQFAELVNTVSPGYARETLTPDGGYGLAPYLNNKGDRYRGILNGVDYDEWNPETDPFIPQTFSIRNLKGKEKCKAALQQRMNLELAPQMPIIGVVSRFADQKGLDILAATVENVILNMQVQFAILGSGHKGLESYFGELPMRYPGRIGSYIGYSNELAHLIEAGSDFFIMPSRYEPCGLNQIYSLRYGTLPIVRATGGLDDTVEQYNENTGEGTGFKFWETSAQAIYFTIGWAVSTWYDRPHHFKQLVKNAMKKRFSWEDSAKEYEKEYYRALQIKA